MVQWRFYLVLSVVMTNLSILSTSYIYQEVDGSFDNCTEFNFDIFLNRSSGTIMYAIDSNNKKIVLQISTTAAGPELSYNMINKISMKEACGCSTCFGTLLQLSIQFGDYLVTMKCNNNSRIFQPFYIGMMHDQLNYPIPEFHNTNKKKIYVWMGNIGPYVGKNGILYYPIKRQLAGCLRHFQYNRQSIIFTNYAHVSSVPCDEDYSETMCNKDKCTNQNISIVIRPFHIQFSRCEYCDKESFYNHGRNQSFVANETFPYIKLIKWTHSNNSGYCLVEMKLRDESLMVMHIDRYNQLIVSVINITSRNIQSKILDTLSINTNNSVTIHFDDSAIEIRNYKFAPISSPQLINFGFSQFSNLCHAYRDKIDFQDDSSQKKSSDSLYNEWSGDSMPSYVIITAVIIGLIVVFIGLLFLFYWRIKKVINPSNTQVTKAHAKRKVNVRTKEPQLMGQLQDAFEAVNETCIYRTITD